MEDRNEATDGLSVNVSGGTSDTVVTPCSSPTCDGFGDGYSVRVHREEEGVNVECRAARTRACEARSKATWLSGLSSNSEEGVFKLSSEETPSLVVVCVE